MKFLCSCFKLNLSNTLSIVVEILFFTTLFFFASCSSENQNTCDPSQEIKKTINHTWEGIKKDTSSRKSQISQCIILDSLARICPYQFADYIVAANAMASMKCSEYNQWSYFLERGEEAVSTYDEYLSNDFLLRTKIAISYERCRFNDSQGFLEEAIHCYESLWDELPSEHNDDILSLFKYVIPTSIGWLSVEVGDFKNALFWLQNAEPNLPSDDIVNLGIFYNLKGRVNELLKEDSLAEKNYTIASEYYNQSERGRRSNHCYENYVNLSDLFLNQSRNEEALQLLKTANKNSNISSRRLFLINYQFSKVYFSLNRLKESVEHGKLALTYSTEIKAGNYYWKGRILEVLSKSLAGQGRFEVALDSINSGIHHLLDFDYWEKESMDNSDLKESNTKLDLLKCLILKSNILKKYANHESDLKSQLQEKALESFMMTIDLIKVLRAGYQYDEVKEYLSEQSFPVFENALKVAFKLFEKTREEKYLDYSFSIIETSKSFSLLEKLKDTKAKETFGLPKELLAEETRINLRIAKEERKLNKSKELDPNTKIQHDSLLYYRAKRKKLIGDLKQKYPNYYNLKYDVSPVKINEIKKVLETEETFVEYFFGKELVYVFSISKSETSLNSFLVTDEFNEDLENFINLSKTRRKLDSTDRIKQYHEIGYKLYNKLLEKIAVKTKKLILVPDGPLHFLPFAALPTSLNSEEELSKLPYLIKSHVIKNNFSASVLFQQYLNNKDQSQKSKSLLVIAPKDFPNNSNLSIDSNRLALIFNDKIQIERVTTKNEAIDLLTQNFQNVFFLSHAAIAGDEPYIQLSNDTLYLSEIYATPISSDLVLLGACETGLGKDVRGEGVHSLARGFAYQDVPNIIMTLWKVRQNSTSPFLTDLLKFYVLDRMPLPEAMQKVQIEAINSYQTEEPFHWAGFVIMGGMSLATID